MTYWNIIQNGRVILGRIGSILGKKIGTPKFALKYDCIIGVFRI